MRRSGASFGEPVGRHGPVSSCGSVQSRQPRFFLFLLVVHEVAEHIYKYAHKHDANAHDEQQQRPCVVVTAPFFALMHFQHPVQHNDEVDCADQQANAYEERAGIV